MYSRPCRSEKYPLAPPHLFNSRINNNAFLLRRLLFIFCSCWRRLLLKDKFFTCLFVESLSLPLLCHCHFHCHRCSYDNYFYKLKFYFTIIVFITSCISFFFFYSKDPMWVVWLPFLSVFCHMGNFECGNGGWTPVMKIDGREVHNLLNHSFPV